MLMTESHRNEERVQCTVPCMENSCGTAAAKPPRFREMWGVPESEIYAMAMWSISVGALGAAVIGIILANTDYFLPTTDKATLEYLEDTDLKPISDGKRNLRYRETRSQMYGGDRLWMALYVMDRVLNWSLWVLRYQPWDRKLPRAPHTGDMTTRAPSEESRTLKAKELWERNGAVIMAVRRPGCFLCREEASEISQLKPELDQLGVPLYGVVKEKIGTEIDQFQPYFKGDLFLDVKKRFYGPQKRKMMLLGFIRLGVWQNFRRAWKAGFEGNLEGEGLILGGVFVVGSGKQGILLEHREKEFGDKANLTAVLEAAKKINTEVH
ncbi:unnamed protein product [Ranitomeya imitator]|uniref:Peroxiredoxin-like 2A n=1 Tax=Ranitomeya imitator TaxID=111125 RepID=A0ABN9M062_9NEOB|nr:unnamed protein product [Ranitomeya imitator]